MTKAQLSGASPSKSGNLRRAGLTSRSQESRPGRPPRDGLAISSEARDAALATPGAPDPFDLSAEARQQMASLVSVARRGANGRSPAGRCYAAVTNYLLRSGYANIAESPLPWEYSRYARHFADFANEGDNAAVLGLRRLPLDNPYDAPPGAVVVVRAGSPGTRHPKAGDISIAAGGGRFFNDGEMTYGGPERFPPGNDFVLGVYVPL